MAKKQGLTFKGKARKRKRAHGFRNRMKTKSGRRTINRRRKKGRKQLAV